MNYYEVGLGVEKHWKSNQFTYSSKSAIKNGTLVRVPFGKQKKIGVIIEKTKKPDFDIKEIVEITTIIISDEQNKFLWWFNKFYRTSHGEAMKQLIPNYLTSPKTYSPKNIIKTKNIHKLTTDQTNAIKEIESTKKPSVLHGITGSGKTRIYSELIKKQIKLGVDSLLLLPEIALTSQIVEQIQEIAPVIVFNSKLTNAQRSKIWFYLALEHQPCVVIGPRSAMFLPYSELGLIILDEAHDSSYKQNNNVRYNSAFVAGGLAKNHNAKLILGSATPPLNESGLILQSGGNLVCIHAKAKKTISDKNIEIVDIRERKNYARHPLFSNILLDRIGESIKNKMQSLIFINRRGTAKLLLCSGLNLRKIPESLLDGSEKSEVLRKSSRCDWTSECQKCDLPLTYHHDLHRMICHTCGTYSDVLKTCPNCSSSTLFKSFGSKAIAEELQMIFKTAKIGRYDSDTKSEESFFKNYQDIKAGNVDILVGTQQIAKGLDLPLLATVGVINADLSMHFPDYTSDERTFQLLSQVFGRVGRGHKSDGSIIVQTRQPSSPIIKLSMTEDWHRFRAIELENRKEHNFPPYIHVLKLIFRNKKFDKANSEADITRRKIIKNIAGVEVKGPVPSFVPKRNNNYYVQLHIYSKKRNLLIKASTLAPSTALTDFDPISLL